jgi:hypothetical protein
MLLTEGRDWQAKENVVLKFVEEAKSGRMARPETGNWHGIPFAGFLRDLRR